MVCNQGKYVSTKQLTYFLSDMTKGIQTNKKFVLQSFSLKSNDNKDLIQLKLLPIDITFDNSGFFGMGN